MRLDDRLCSTCGDTYTPTGTRQRLCVKCRDPYAAQWRAENLDHNQRLNAAYRHRHRDKLRRDSIEKNVRIGANPGDVESLMALWDSRSGLCEICLESEDVTGKAMAMDHCHRTKTFRGFLCHRCNTGLSWFREDINALRRAQDYLEGAK